LRAGPAGRLESKFVRAWRGRIAFSLGAAAVGWAFFLVSAAFWFPAYAGEDCEFNGGCTSSSATLFSVNGWWVVELLAAVALVTALAFYALHAVCSRQSQSAALLATLCIVALAGFAVVTGFSIGLFVLPIALLLLASRRAMPSSGASQPSR
jgi:hypothetical protein